MGQRNMARQEESVEANASALIDAHFSIRTLHLTAQLTSPSMELPLDTPSSKPSATATTGARLPVLESVSPAGGFVSIFTPQDKSRDPESEEIDADGIRLHAWSSAELTSFDCKSAYFWTVTLCPCFAVAQIEARLGLKSYARALTTSAATYTGFIVAFTGSIVTFFSFFSGGGHSHGALLWLLLAFCCFAALVARRVAKLRTTVRARFMIPGSERDDGYVGCLHTTRAIRQMGHHVQCDRTVFCAAPATLHAYEV